MDKKVLSPYNELVKKLMVVSRFNKIKKEKQSNPFGCNGESICSQVSPLPPLGFQPCMHIGFEAQNKKIRTRSQHIYTPTNLAGVTNHLLCNTLPTPAERYRVERLTSRVSLHIPQVILRVVSIHIYILELHTVTIYSIQTEKNITPKYNDCIQHTVFLIKCQTTTIVHRIGIKSSVYIHNNTSYLSVTSIRTSVYPLLQVPDTSINWNTIL